MGYKFAAAFQTTRRASHVSNSTMSRADALTVSRSSSSSSLDLPERLTLTPTSFNIAEGRRTRKRITAAQLAQLEDLYRQSSHPTRDQRDALAKRIQMYVFISF